MQFLFLTFFLLQAGASLPRCSRNPASTLPFDSTRALSLVGAFHLEYVDTTQGTRASGGLDLVLWPNDSAHRYRYMVRQIGRDFGERPFGGTYRYPGAPWIDPEEPNRGIKLNGADIYIGSIAVNDGAGTYLTVRRVGPSGFFGRWTEEMGIAMLVDSKGRRLPDPAGYFCAWRREPFEDAPKQP